MESRLGALVEACAAQGIPVTQPRRAVLIAVLEMETHPTADDVFEQLRRTGSRISRATVFRALETLVELGMITKSCHPGRGVRYDRVNFPHHHLVCLRCGAMMDFVDDELDALPVPDTSTFGFRVTDCRVQVRGHCQKCQTDPR